MADTQQARALGIIVKPVGVRLAQIVCITASAFLSGQTAASSYALLPCIMASPATLLARQFKQICWQIRLSAPLVVIGTTVLFSWLASREPSTSTASFRGYLAAAILLPSCIPYSRLFVTPTEEMLLARAKDSERLRGSTFKVEDVDEKGSLDDAVVLQRKQSSLAQFVQAMASKKGVGHSNLETMSTHQLVDRWGWLNLGRAGLMAASALAAGYAVVAEDLSFFELF